MAMRLKMIGLGPKIGGTKESPRASAMVWIENIDEASNIADVKYEVIKFVAPSVTFPVPNPTGMTNYEETLLFLETADPEFVGANTAVATVQWALVKASPMEIRQPDGTKKKPSDTGTGEVLGPEYSFDTAGGTKHITQSVDTRDKIAIAGTTAPDVKGAIGVEKHSIKGCDIATGDLKWSVKVKGVPVTASYIDTLVRLTGSINSSPWYGRDAGELLFLGASGTYKPGDAWECTFNFHQEKNKAGFSIAAGLPSFDFVGGHDYIWCLYSKTTVGGFTVETPVAAYCEIVYNSTDFRDLLI